MQSGEQNLRLVAHSLQDLSVIGSMLQDALVPVGDISFQSDANRFLIVFNRFCWEKAGEEGPYERIHASMRFESVEKVQYRGIDRSNPDIMLSLLTIAYDPDGAGEGKGAVVLQFAGNCAIRLLVGTLRCGLEDMGEAWPTPWRPDHSKDES